MPHKTDPNRLLGKPANTVLRWKRAGVPKAYALLVALACRALLHRLEPYE